MPKLDSFKKDSLLTWTLTFLSELIELYQYVRKS